MSLVKIEGNASGTGVFTVASPNSNTDRTLTLPDTSGTLVAPSSAGTSGQVLTSNGAGSSPTYQDLPAGGVTSLNGQTGAITNTDYGAIGSYIIAVHSGLDMNSAFASVGPNVTVAGSVLHRGSDSNATFGTNIMNLANNSSLTSQTSGATTSLGLSGTWRLLTQTKSQSSGGFGSVCRPMVFAVRIS